MSDIENRIKKAIRDIPDFPKPGIIFRDITPVLQDVNLRNDIIDTFIQKLDNPPDIICAIESRGFYFGPLIADRLKIPFIPVRKEGKLPGDTIAYSYDLEYGSSTVEIHRNIIPAGANVLIHDDLLATGGTAKAAAELVLQQNGKIHGFAFLVTLEFLNGRESLMDYSTNIISLASYS